MYRSSSTVTFRMTFILLPLYICDLTIFKNRLSNWRHKVRFANKFLQAFIYLFMKRNGKNRWAAKMPRCLTMSWPKGRSRVPRGGAVGFDAPSPRPALRHAGLSFRRCESWWGAQAHPIDHFWLCPCLSRVTWLNPQADTLLTYGNSNQEKHKESHSSSHKGCRISWNYCHHASSIDRRPAETSDLDTTF
jgi:hypothetical protein